jgi:hypothetical protein
MKPPAPEPNSKPNPPAQPQLEDPAARVKRLTEMLRARLRQSGGTVALESWLRDDR